MDSSPCVLLDGQETAARYVAERLDQAELESFELHLLTCVSCRAAVAFAAELRSALRAARPRSAGPAVGVLGTAAAAVVAWMIMAPGALEKLGRVDQAPRVEPMEVRAHLDSAAFFAQRGIRAYGRAHYEEAARDLSRAFAEQPEPGTGFFLGSALLMSGAADSAAVLFQKVIAAGGSAYQSEAHYYAAKAWLQQGEAEPARAHLARAALAPGQRLRANALLDSLKRVR